MNINYITNLSLEDNSGGGSGVNYAIYHELASRASINYLGPIKVPIDRRLHYVSKLTRLMGGKGKYFFYADSRLNKIKEIVESQIQSHPASLNFFNGITPWIKVCSHAPYVAYTDACFYTYINVFNKVNDFSTRDKDRIFKLEAEWISKAACIFFRSRWAMEETKKAYGLTGENFLVAGLGGFVPIPDQIIRKKDKSILFISKEFVPKGGLSCYKAFLEVRKQFPDFQLTIIGERPPDHILNEKGVRYLGMLRKNMENEMQLFRDTMSRAFLLVHPTKKDTNALVLTEAGYFGCPSVTVRDFAIPEFIEDGKTGYLVDNPDDYQVIAEKIIILIEQPEIHDGFVVNARNYTTGHFTWQKVGERMHQKLNEILQ